MQCSADRPTSPIRPLLFLSPAAVHPSSPLPDSNPKAAQGKTTKAACPTDNKSGASTPAFTLELPNASHPCHSSREGDPELSSLARHAGPVIASIILTPLRSLQLRATLRSGRLHQVILIRSPPSCCCLAHSGREQLSRVAPHSAPLFQRAPPPSWALAQTFASAAFALSSLSSPPSRIDVEHSEQWHSRRHDSVLRRFACLLFRSLLRGRASRQDDLSAAEGSNDDDNERSERSQRCRLAS